MFIVFLSSVAYHLSKLPSRRIRHSLFDNSTWTLLDDSVIFAPSRIAVLPTSSSGLERPFRPLDDARLSLADAFFITARCNAFRISKSWRLSQASRQNCAKPLQICKFKGELVALPHEQRICMTTAIYQYLVQFAKRMPSGSGLDLCLNRNEQSFIQCPESSWSFSRLWRTNACDSCRLVL